MSTQWIIPDHYGMDKVAHEIATLEAEIRRLELRLSADQIKYSENFDQFAFGDGAIIRDELMNRYEKRIKETKDRIKELKDQLQRARKRQLKLLKPGN